MIKLTRRDFLKTAAAGGSGLALSLTLTGCGSSDSSNESSESVSADEQEADDLSEARTITAWLYKDDYKLYDSYDDNPVVQYLEDMFNVDLQFQQPAMGSETEQFSLMLGTGSYTDVFDLSYCTEGTLTLYEDGVIQDLAPYMETYMPNYYEWINREENEDVKRALYDSEGHYLTLPLGIYENGDTELMWGGLVYRYDILETMTGGEVSFPSGNENPTTVDDMEYMLELYYQYFNAAGFTDYACLILPYMGYFQTGELVSGFGTTAAHYIAEDGETVLFGPVQEGFYNYLTTMHRWYEKGYIYQDFASRTNDMFYLPNTSLTYGAAAGIWYGLISQVGDVMSMEDYGLYFDVKGMSAPADTENGVDEPLSYLSLRGGRATMNAVGYAVSSACSEENLIRWLTVCDYLLTDEGGMLRSYGLNAEQAASSTLYQELGLEDGFYTLDEDGNFSYNPLTDINGGEYYIASYNNYLTGARLPGKSIFSYQNENQPEENVAASNAWTLYGNKQNYPSAITLGSEEADRASTIYTTMYDYINTMVPRFIMGSEELTEESFQKFVDQLYAYGLEEYLGYYQDAYDEYMA